MEAVEVTQLERVKFANVKDDNVVDTENDYLRPSRPKPPLKPKPTISEQAVAREEML